MEMADERELHGDARSGVTETETVNGQLGLFNISFGYYIRVLRLRKQD
jgi:hypothetical protein